MTAFFDSAKAIISRFNTQWAAAHAGFPIVHDNEHYEPVEGSDFVYISVQFTSANAISLGGPTTSLIRHAGLLEINLALQAQTQENLREQLWLKTKVFGHSLERVENPLK